MGLEGQGVVVTLRTEMEELQKQNDELRQQLAQRDRVSNGPGLLGAPGELCPSWDVWWLELLRPLQRRCEEEASARLQAELESAHWQEQAKLLECEASVRAAQASRFQGEVATS